VELACEGVDFGVDPLPDFHQRMAALRESGHRVVPVCYLGQTAWLVLRHAEVAALYRSEAEVPAAPAYRRHSEPAQGRTLLCMEGDEHRVNRLLVSGAFHPNAVREAVTAVLEPLAHELVDSLSNATGADLVAAFCHRYPFKVITHLLGVPVADEPLLQAWLDGLFQYPWDPQCAIEARAAITDYLAPVVDERRRQPRDDLLSLLATAEVEGRHLEDEEIYAFVRLIFPAGADTTYLSLGSLLWAVLGDRRLYQQLLLQPGLRDAAVEEGLRLYGAVCLQPRYTERPVTIAGVTIPAQSVLLYGNAPANRDPEVFDDPEAFLLQRPPRHRAVTFGGGPHYCLGAHLARAEIRTGLGVVLDRLSGLALAPPGSPGPTGAVLRGVRSLPVTWDQVLPADRSQPVGR
jgi:cytochrome P450